MWIVFAIVLGGKVFIADFNNVTSCTALKDHLALSDTYKGVLHPPRFTCEKRHVLFP
jgi:hypothetical protein